MKTLDSTGKPCPLPILDLARALRGAGEGERVRLLATDPAIERDLRAFCEATGHRLLQLDRLEGRVCATVERGPGPTRAQDP